MTNCYLSSIRAASGLPALHAHSLGANPRILASRRQLWFSNLIIKPSMKRLGFVLRCIGGNVIWSSLCPVVYASTPVLGELVPDTLF
jgi:hypothetical protein